MTWLISKAMMDAYMNSHSSPEQVEEFLGASFLDGEQSVQLNVISTQHSFSHRDKTTDISRLSRFGLTYRHLTGYLGEDVLTWFQEGFPARTYPQQEKEQVSKDPDQDSGVTWQESSVRYDPDTHSWKTHRCLLSEDLPWSSVTLPKWGMMRSGVLWERTTLPDFTDAKGAGSVQSWPTPTARDWKDSPGMATTGVNPDGSVINRLNRLPMVVFHTFPTPCITGMASGSGNCAKVNKLHEQGIISEDERKSMRAGNGGQLNPDWVEWLMGWPVGWTRLSSTNVRYMDWSDGDPADTGEVPRLDYDIPNRIDRLRAIGNGQVPAVAAVAWRILHGLNPG